MLFASRHSVVLSLVRFSLCAALVCAVIVPVASADDTDRLRDLRTQRREAIRAASASADKSGSPALFGLMVIPVDFADARLPDTWDDATLSNRLTSPGTESVGRYFSMASRGLLGLRITQTPVVHLPGTRRDYSDIGFNGFTRTRALATESLEAIRDLGVEFRRLDMDGPDRIPGTDDDDGQVDGVLILHAGVGQENDPAEGLIQALQFFLDEPVVSQGISATSYAVASLTSGPGIWAHETAHLLGLEDRYDHSLRPSGGSEFLSRGGLGRFSLMASGAWGTGGGYGAALPDAYSWLQLGWSEERNLYDSAGQPDTLRSGLVSGKVDRLWSRGYRTSEYFLLETRDPAAAFPYDADVPEGQLLIYHVDEDLPEGQLAVDGPDRWHLRVSLVEADDDFLLRRGEDAGRPEDLFPGPLGKNEFGPLTTPNSDGYMTASQVRLSGINLIPGGLIYETSVWPEPHLDFWAGFSGQTEVLLQIEARPTGTPFSSLNCVVTAAQNPTWGIFQGGSPSTSFDLVPDGQGTWRPTQPVVWLPDLDIPSDAHTTFIYEFLFDGVTRQWDRTWYWQDNGNVLDFESSWPGGWATAMPSGNTDTNWHRWNGGPWLTADQTPVLVCTGSDHLDGTAWPQVTYENSGHATLTSGFLGPGIRGVRLIHAMEVEQLTADIAMDGGTVTWIASGNPQPIPGEPLSGWRGRISPQAYNVLHGQDALISQEMELEGDIPLWQTEIIPVPEGLPGPWKLRLEFGSNSLWRYRGWVVAQVDPLYSDPAEAIFEGSWQSGPAGDLSWTWPWDQGGPSRFIIQMRDGPESPWQEIADELFLPRSGDGRFSLAAFRVYPHLGNNNRKRFDMRVLGFIDQGKVATRPVVVFPDGGDGQAVTLGLPWPNPARDSVRFLVEIPAGNQADLGIFDLRGRRIFQRRLAGGSQLIEWDGRNHRGSRVASGSYIIRLEGSGPVIMRKVVLIH